MNRTKLLSSLLWLYAAYQLVNAVLSTFLIEQGAAMYGFSEWIKDENTRHSLYQYGMVLYVLAAAYAIIATDVVKYEQMLWIAVVEQIVGAILSTQELLQANVINWGQFATVHTFHGIILILLYVLRPSADASNGKLARATA